MPLSCSSVVCMVVEVINFCSNSNAEEIMLKLEHF